MSDQSATVQILEVLIEPNQFDTPINQTINMLFKSITGCEDYTSKITTELLVPFQTLENRMDILKQLLTLATAVGFSWPPLMRIDITLPEMVEKWTMYSSSLEEGHPVRATLEELLCKVVQPQIKESPQPESCKNCPLTPPSDMETLTLCCDLLQRDNTELNIQNEALEGQNKALMERNSNLLENNTKLQNQLRRVESQIENNNDQLNEELQNAKTEIANLKQRWADLSYYISESYPENH